MDGSNSLVRVMAWANRYGGADLVLGMAGGFFGEVGLKGGVSSESECTATHHDAEGGISEDGFWLHMHNDQELDLGHPRRECTWMG